jgi:hypothetical protein
MCREDGANVRGGHSNRVRGVLELSWRVGLECGSLAQTWDCTGKTFLSMQDPKAKVSHFLNNCLSIILLHILSSLQINMHNVCVQVKIKHMRYVHCAFIFWTAYTDANIDNH